MVRPPAWAGVAAGLVGAGWYLLATLPRLGDYPAPTDWGELEIAAPAWKLASQGTYGNDLFDGFHRAEQRYYVFMPLYPVLVALAFAVAGPGIAQARAVSVLGGFAAAGLTFALGRALRGRLVGLLAAAGLLAVALALPPEGSVPLLDLARVIRFDVLVPAWILAAALGLARARDSGGPWAFVATGALLGLGTSTHVYAAFAAPAFAVVVLVCPPAKVPPGRALALLVAGFGLACLPWLAFVASDLDAFVGQMRRHQGRFEVLDPVWYLTNLRREHWRYARWVGGAFSQPVLWPRVGLWVFAGGLLAGVAALVHGWRRGRRPGDLLLIAVPLALEAGLALLVNQKRYTYTIAVLPFLMLVAAVGWGALWERGAGRRLLRAACVALGAATAAEGAWAIRGRLERSRDVVSYAAVIERVSRHIPDGARLLLPQPLWMGFRNQPVRSLALPLFQADARMHPPGRALDMEEALEATGAEYAVVETRFESYVNPDNPVVEELWRRLAAVVHRRCAAIDRVALPPYEPMTVYRCGFGR